MSYLILNDYNRLIQDVTIQQIISGNTYLQTKGELVAVSEITSYLIQKYDIASEFTETGLYNPFATYKAADRVYIDAPAYSNTSPYALGTLVLFNGSVYQCSSAITIPEAFDPAKWLLLGAQYDIFYAKYPAPVFNLQACYKVGDRVFWKDHTYTALLPSRFYSHDDLIQFGNTAYIPYRNVFPDDPKCGPTYWHDEGLYVIPPSSLLTTISGDGQTVSFIQVRENLEIEADFTSGFVSGGISVTDASLKGWRYSLERVNYGTMQKDIDYALDIPDNPDDPPGWHLLKAGDIIQPHEKFVYHFLPVYTTTLPDPLPGSLTVSQIFDTYFIKGDNRNQQILMYTIDIALYHMYARIAPKSIPELRIARYNAAIAWLRMSAKGDITANITKIQPPSGKRIRWGSNIKQQNNY